MATPISIGSNTTQTLVAIVFGITATLISGVTVYQAFRTWQIWRQHQQQNIESRGLLYHTSELIASMLSFLLSVLDIELVHEN